jgi:hypothetical protein
MLVGKAIAVLLSFSTAHLCEKAFSSYSYVKTKFRNTLKTDYDLRLYLSSMILDLKMLILKFDCLSTKQQFLPCPCRS